MALPDNSKSPLRNLAACGVKKIPALCGETVKINLIFNESLVYETSLLHGFTVYVLF